MLSKFYKDLTVEERREWRQHPTTMLALEMLREFLADSAERALNAGAGTQGDVLNHRIGVHFGIQESITLLEKE